MTRVEIRLTELNNDGSKSVAAFLKTRNKDFLLESAELENVSWEDDLELLESFCTHWEMLGDEEGLKIEFDPEVDQLIVELEFSIDY
jgi:hypothetical protein